MRFILASELTDYLQARYHPCTYLLEPYFSASLAFLTCLLIADSWQSWQGSRPAARSLYSRNIPVLWPFFLTKVGRTPRIGYKPRNFVAPRRTYPSTRVQSPQDTRTKSATLITTPTLLACHCQWPITNPPYIRKSP